MTRLPLAVPFVLLLASGALGASRLACPYPDPCYGGCDDGNPCTDDACYAYPPYCGCVHYAVLCDDHNPCTTDRCSDTAGCVYDPVPAGAACFRNSCTVGARCEKGRCAGGTTVPCDDASPCTEDVCDEELGCVYIQIIPAEVTNLEFPDPATLTWKALSAAPAGTAYDVARGVVEQLPVGNGGASEETCLDWSRTETRMTDPETPPGGSAYWYLIRARDPVCGAGSFGFEERHGQPAAARIFIVCP